MPGIPGDHGEHRQLGSRTRLPGAHRDLRRREPDTAVSELSGRRAVVALAVVLRQVMRPQVDDAVAQHGNRPVPSDLLRDQRRRHHGPGLEQLPDADRKSTRLNSSHSQISYAVFCLKKKKKHLSMRNHTQNIPTYTKPKHLTFTT